MAKSKVETYLGFCIRAQKILFGIDNVESAKRGVYLLLCDEALGESSFKTLIKSKEKFACPLVITEAGRLGELLHRPAVKTAAVKDKNLAAAILSALKDEPQLKLYSGGNN